MAQHDATPDPSQDAEAPSTATGKLASMLSQEDAIGASLDEKERIELRSAGEGRIERRQRERQRAVARKGRGKN